MCGTRVFSSLSKLSHYRYYHYHHWVAHKTVNQMDFRSSCCTYAAVTRSPFYWYFHYYENNYRFMQSKDLRGKQGVEGGVRRPAKWSAWDFKYKYIRQNCTSWLFANLVWPLNYFVPHQDLCICRSSCCRKAVGNLWSFLMILIYSLLYKEANWYGVKKIHDYWIISQTDGHLRTLNTV